MSRLSSSSEMRLSFVGLMLCFRAYAKPSAESFAVMIGVLDTQNTLIELVNQWIVYICAKLDFGGSSMIVLFAVKV